MPGQERGTCEITDELFNDSTLSNIIILENRDEKSSQYDTNEIKMPNHDDNIMAQNQGEVPHNNIKENCTSISQHLVQSIKSNIKIWITQMFQMPINYIEFTLKVSLPHPFLQIQGRRRNFISIEGRKR